MISWSLVRPVGFRGQSCHLVESVHRRWVLFRRAARAVDVWDLGGSCRNVVTCRRCVLRNFN
jgi:hypothetical protein